MAEIRDTSILGWPDDVGVGPYPTPGLSDEEKIADIKERLWIPPDDPTGYQQAPARYTAQGRETIDRIRDQLGDEGFAAFCLGNAIKYEDRAGLKGDPEGDERKAVWYRRMLAHVQGDGPDPRCEREGFRAYERPADAWWLAIEPTGELPLTQENFDRAMAQYREARRAEQLKRHVADLDAVLEERRANQRDEWTVSLEEADRLIAGWGQGYGVKPVLFYGVLVDIVAVRQDSASGKVTFTARVCPVPPAEVAE